MKTQHQVNQQQYQDKAVAYLQSQVHAQGEEFVKMRQCIENYRLKHILDLGCGGGHVTYQLASSCDAITAYDVTENMVQLVLEQAKKLQLQNVTGQVGTAEALGFEKATFDCIVSRYSAHHWQNVAQAMQEMYRVLVPQGKVILFDILGSAHPILDGFLQTIEMIRDPSHVRDYSLQEWTKFAEYAGFKVEQIEIQSLELNFQSWVTRMQTPSFAVETIRNLQLKVSDQVRHYFKIQPDGSFSTQTLYMVLSKVTE